MDGNVNVSTTFSTIPRTDTGIINSTPRAITSPVLRVKEGCNHTIAIPVTDPDNDIIRCRWAVGSECADICNSIPGAVLDQDSCTITYKATKGTGYKAVALMIEDFTIGSSSPLSSVALQFLVYVFSSTQPCSSSPAFIPPTIQEDACIAIPPGETFHTQIIADSLSPDVSISEIETVSPAGMIKGIISQVMSSNLYHMNISWTPNANQMNQTHLFCYTAINSDGLTNNQVCIKFYPGIYPPKPIKLVGTSNNTWKIVFDKSIQRPSVPAFIAFLSAVTDEEIYKIDASTSPELIFKDSNEILISPSYLFTKQKDLYMKFDRGVVKGLDGCQPDNEPIQDKEFWKSILDTTKPDIHAHFIIQTSIRHSNVYFSWLSSEAVTWKCEMVHDDLLETDVNCSEGSWSGRNLPEGNYKLHVEATDKAGNKAVTVHAFSIDRDLLEPTPQTISSTVCSSTSSRFTAHVTYSKCK